MGFCDYLMLRLLQLGPLFLNRAAPLPKKSQITARQTTDMAGGEKKKMPVNFVMTKFGYIFDNGLYKTEMEVKKLKLYQSHSDTFP